MLVGHVWWPGILGKTWASTVSTSRYGVWWLLAFVVDVLLAVFHKSRRAVAVVSVVSELLAFVTLRDGGFGIL